MFKMSEIEKMLKMKNMSFLPALFIMHRELLYLQD